MPFYMFGSAMCSFVAFPSRSEYQASRISLCTHADDLPNISTFSISAWLLRGIWSLANREFSSNVEPMAFVCPFTRVFSAHDVWPMFNHNRNLYIRYCARLPWKSLSWSCFLAFWICLRTSGANRQPWCSNLEEHLRLSRRILWHREE